MYINTQAIREVPFFACVLCDLMIIRDISKKCIRTLCLKLNYFNTIFTSFAGFKNVNLIENKLLKVLPFLVILVP